MSLFAMRVKRERVFPLPEKLRQLGDIHRDPSRPMYEVLNLLGRSFGLRSVSIRAEPERDQGRDRIKWRSHPLSVHFRR